MNSNNLKLAIRWEVKVEGNNRSIQLFDAKDNKLEGHEAYWEGYFYCNNNQLTSLLGAPQTVDGGFYCHNNQLTSLLGAPQTVGNSFYCHKNQLASLEGAPQTVGGDFYCSYNPLNALEIFRYRKFVIKSRSDL